jgi:methionyl-tRNA formyltransferase
LRIVFAGTPDFAARALTALIEAGHQIVLVLTQPDRPSGRGMQVHPSPVKQLALDHGIEVVQPSGLRISGRYDADARAAHERLQMTPHDVMVVAAYGLILPPSVLAIPPRGCINIHASLLPRWRGAAPIQRAIEAGDTETGITIMQMDAGLDTGDTLLFRKVAISPSDTAASLTEVLADLGGVAIVEALAGLEVGVLAPVPQNPTGDSSAVTYAAKLSKAEAPLDFGLGTRVLVDRIRAFDPWPGCSADLVDSGSAAIAPFKIWAAKPFATDLHCAPGDVLGYIEQGEGIAIATGDGAIVLTELQKPGGKRLAARHFRSEFSNRSMLKLTGKSA